MACRHVYPTSLFSNIFSLKMAFKHKPRVFAMEIQFRALNLQVLTRFPLLVIISRGVKVRYILVDETIN